MKNRQLAIVRRTGRRRLPSWSCFPEEPESGSSGSGWWGWRRAVTPKDTSRSSERRHTDTSEDRKRHSSRRRETRPIRRIAFSSSFCKKAKLWWYTSSFQKFSYSLYKWARTAFWEQHCLCLLAQTNLTRNYFSFVGFLKTSSSMSSFSFCFVLFCPWFS